MHCSFTIDHYKEIIELARDKGYAIIKVKDYGNENPFKKGVILLRHDIDWSLEYAYELANIEYDLGVKSSYYVYLHSGTYNALAPESMKMIKEMNDMGHEIGLHYDSRYDDNPTDFDCKTVTQHWPASNQKLNLNILDPNDLPIKYISDSGRNWRSKCLCQHLGKEDKLHVNMHPEWWLSGGIDRWDAVNKMYQSFESRLARDVTDIRNMLSDYEKEVIAK